MSNQTSNEILFWEDPWGTPMYTNGDIDESSISSETSSSSGSSGGSSSDDDGNGNGGYSQELRTSAEDTMDKTELNDLLCSNITTCTGDNECKTYGSNIILTGTLAVVQSAFEVYDSTSKLNTLCSDKDGYSGICGTINMISPLNSTDGETFSMEFNWCCCEEPPVDEVTDCSDNDSDCGGDCIGQDIKTSGWFEDYSLCVTGQTAGGSGDALDTQCQESVGSNSTSCGVKTEPCTFSGTNGFWNYKYTQCCCVGVLIGTFGVDAKGNCTGRGGGGPVSLGTLSAGSYRFNYVSGASSQWSSDDHVLADGTSWGCFFGTSMGEVLFASSGSYTSFSSASSASSGKSVTLSWGGGNATAFFPDDPCSDNRGSVSFNLYAL